MMTTKLIALLFAHVHVCGVIVFGESNPMPVYASGLALHVHVPGDTVIRIIFVHKYFTLEIFV